MLDFSFLVFCTTPSHTTANVLITWAKQTLLLTVTYKYNSVLIQKTENTKPRWVSVSIAGKTCTVIYIHTPGFKKKEGTFDSPGIPPGGGEAAVEDGGGGGLNFHVHSTPPRTRKDSA